MLAGLWSGEPFSFEGKHFKIDEAQFLPKPLQQPRIPIWLAGRWPARRPFLRAAAWDGVVPVGGSSGITPDECRELVALVGDHRGSGAPFDIAVFGSDRREGEGEAERAQRFAEAGATWYQVTFDGAAPPDSVRERLRRGPPAGSVTRN